VFVDTVRLLVGREGYLSRADSEGNDDILLCLFRIPKLEVNVDTVRPLLVRATKGHTTHSKAVQGPQRNNQVLVLASQVRAALYRPGSTGQSRR
jgi:hypothetical protein